tara:strand:- start:92 stop:787 length:696 start_codon:yes stop_codon:yes gene_type:complete
MRQAVLYSRVSTSHQEKSGLGKEAQIAEMTAFCEREGYEILKVFVDDAVSGSIHPQHRPALRGAMVCAEATGATIIVSKLDRISRSVEHVAQMINQGVPFIVCSHPTADAFMLQLLSCFAEQERAQISQRVKAMWAAKRARGEKMGNPESLDGEKAREANIARGRQSAMLLGYEITEAKNYLVFRNGGSEKGITYPKIADEMNRRGITTPRGGKWTDQTVRKMLKRYKKLV